MTPVPAGTTGVERRGRTLGAMAAMERYDLGYQRVDDDPDVAVLIDAMDQTAAWDATHRLRAWERHELRLAAGERLLDVGCGTGDAAIALAADLGDRGEVVGIDASERMVDIARARARAKAMLDRVRFTDGDASSLDEPDDSFDAVRSERTLQWLADPAAAVGEMVRVARPGGRISLIDTDWSTFAIDVGDDALAAVVRDAFRMERGRPSNVGRRLPELLAAAGCEVVARTAATQAWTDWDPDEAPTPPGCFSMDSLADDLVARGQLSHDARGGFVSTIHDAARQGRCAMRLTMFGAVARVR
jgi:SAM-dependent methyltransferase